MMVRLFLALEDSELLCDLCLDPPVRLRGISCVCLLPGEFRIHFTSATHTAGAQNLTSTRIQQTIDQVNAYLAGEVVVAAVEDLDDEDDDEDSDE